MSHPSELSELTVRLAQPSDLRFLQECAVDAYSQYTIRMGRAPAPMQADFTEQISQGIVYVATYRTNAVGYVVFYARGDHMHLESVAVSSHHTGHGIGRRLIAYVESTAKQCGLVAVELYTNEAMIENLRLYPKLGYQETNREEQDGFKRVFYRKALC